MSGSNEHVILEIEIKVDMKDKQDDPNKMKWRNYAKSIYTAMKNFSMKLTGRK